MNDLPAAIIGVIVLLIWTLVLRLFPNILTSAIEKKIESHHASKLARLTAELEAKYSTLRTSVDYLSMQQTALRSHIVSSVEVLWNEILALNKDLGHLFFLDAILVPSEIDDFYASGAQGKVGVVLKDYRDFDHVQDQMSRFGDPTYEKARLFVGERLWLLFHTLRGVYGRYMMLTHMSISKCTYHDWRHDRLMMGHLNSCLTPKEIEESKSKGMGGVQLALTYLKAAFLKEAVRAMSGSQHIADSLADLQSTLLAEKQRLEVPREAEAS